LASPDKTPLEELARKLHAVYQVEAKRQGDVRHHDDYDALPEHVKEFDRVLAAFILVREANQQARHEAEVVRLREALLILADTAFAGRDREIALAALVASPDKPPAP